MQQPRAAPKIAARARIRSIAFFCWYLHSPRPPSRHGRCPTFGKLLSLLCWYMSKVVGYKIAQGGGEESHFRILIDPIALLTKHMFCNGFASSHSFYQN